MTRILITGMSGTGKSSVIENLRNRGYLAIDTDEDDWCVPGADGALIWNESRITALLDDERSIPLFVQGTVENQGAFYDRFDHVVLLSAPLDVILQRVASRTNNPYGKTPRERAEIRVYHEVVEPMLRRGCTMELDSGTMSIEQMTDVLVDLADGGTSS